MPTRIGFKLLSDVVHPSELYPITLAFNIQLSTGNNMECRLKNSKSEDVGPFSVERLATDIAVISPHHVQEDSESNTYYNGGFVATAAIIIFSSAKRRHRSQLAGWLSWLRQRR